MTARTTTHFELCVNSAELYSQLAQRHGHYCPMSTLGLRLGMEAARCLSTDGQNNWQLCYLARTCAVDGITLALENSSLRFDLQVEQQGQHLLLCRDPSGRELSLALSAAALQLAGKYRDLSAAGQQQQLELLRTLAAEQLIEISGMPDR